MSKKLTKSRAFFWIIFSTLIISGFNYVVITKVKKYREIRFIAEKYNIKTIYQNKKNVNLDVNYLAELIDLSFDKPTNIFTFDENEATKKLLKSPIIVDAQVKKMKPDCVFVDYTLREPKAELYDFENTLIDKDGYIFPKDPFFKDQNFCKIFLNLDEFKGFEKIDTKEAKLALDILNKLKASGFSDLVKIAMLDTSRAYLQSYGKREIVLQIDEMVTINKKLKKTQFVFPKILRLSNTNFLEQISNYASLRKKIIKDYENQASNFETTLDIVRFNPKTIDLRISKLAFIDQ
ncbi:MAG TPA: FtsQ-type POTRA domain-containing protein [Chlamydiae bacterium]|nr:FtsQ-type POTRA domain-containing protein [Chlamydiota bacterium]